MPPSAYPSANGSEPDLFSEQYAASAFSVGEGCRTRGEICEAVEALQLAALAWEVVGPASEQHDATLVSLALAVKQLHGNTAAIPVLEGLRRRRSKWFGEQHVAVADVLYQLAARHADIESWKPALNLFQQAFRIQEAELGKDAPELIFTLMGIGFVVFRTGDGPGAEQSFAEAKALASRLSKDNAELEPDLPLPSAPLSGEVEIQSGARQAQTKEPKPQEIVADGSSEPFILDWPMNGPAPAGRDPLVVATAAAQQAPAFAAIGDYGMAMQLRKVQQWASRDGGDKQGLADAIREQGRLFETLGDLTQADGAYDASRRLAEYLGYVFGQALALVRLAGLHFACGQNPEALRCATEALEILARPGHPEPARGLAEVEALTVRASIRLAQANSPGPEQDATALSALGHSHADREVRSAALQSVASIELGRSKLPLAADHAAHAVAAARAAGVGQTQALSLFGEVVAASGRVNVAVEAFADAVDIAWAEDEPATACRLFTRLGKLLFAAGRFADATQVFDAAIDIAQRQTPGSDENVRIISAETQSVLYMWHARSLASSGRVEPALLAFERGRLRALRSRPQSGEDRTGVHTPDLSDTNTWQSLARALGATLVEYAVMREGRRDLELLVWVMRPDGTIQLRRVPLMGREDEVESLVDRARRSLKNGRHGRIKGALAAVTGYLRQDRRTPPLQELYDVLIQPFADLLPDDPDDLIVIVPDGPLFGVPFAALHHRTKGHLIDRHRLATVPSLALLAKLVAEPRASPASHEALVLGDPTPPLRAKYQADLQFLPALLGARIEAAEVARTLRTEALVGDQATRQAFLERAASAGIIHVAAHGILNYVSYHDEFLRRGMPGVLVLASESAESDPGQADALFASIVKVANSGSVTGMTDRTVQGTFDMIASLAKNDGLVTPGDVLELQLQAELVVLSACDTGRGRLGSEGVVGLPWAFLAAGARALVVSLWPIHDEHTLLFMRIFYASLLRGRDKAAALREAALELKRLHAAEKYWAAFTLIGDPRVPSSTWLTSLARGQTAA